MPLRNTLPPRRKAHTKSKFGCAECRRRRVKCTEERPSCNACTRYKISCVYPREASGSRAVSSDLAPSPSAAQSTGQASSTSSAEEESACSSSTASLSAQCYFIQPEVASTEAFSTTDLGLLHHWTLSTSLTMANSPHIDHCWQDTLPRIALQYPFVMHAILSLSSLHLAYTNTATREQHNLDAVRHYDISLEGFREATHNISIENCHALFGCSVLNAMCVISLLRKQDDQIDFASRVSDILGINYIPMIRGVQAVLHPFYDDIRKGPLALLLSLDNWKELDPDGLPFAEAERFRHLEGIWLHSVDGHIYDQALGVLKKCYMHSLQTQRMKQQRRKQRGDERGWYRPILFIHFASEEYFMRLYQRQPHALVLFAYFAVLIHGLEEYWFFYQWGRDIVKVVDKLLGAYWHSWMEWPKRMVGLL